ncbi:MAG: PQQ-binding-like beta-propeller repeat protein [Acidobacteriota bacterium]
MLKRNLFRPVFFVALTTFFITQSTLAQDWAQWRGAGRDGIANGFVQPKSLPEQLQRQWKIEIGIGHASPVVVGKRIFTFTRVGELETVAAYDLASGKPIWKDSYAVDYKMNPAAVTHGKGPKSTPVIANGKLYTFGINGVLSCYDATTGARRWRKEFSKEFKTTSPDFGVAMSPIVDKGLVIAHVGGLNSGALTAFDAETGEVKWRWMGDGPAYASPIVVELGGTRQLVTQSQVNIIGVNPANGELLWQIPFTTAYLQNIVTPVAYKDTLIFSGIDKGTFAVRLTKSDGKFKPETVWENKEVAMYMNSPVLRGDYLYGMSHKKKGQYFCLDARTGKTLWTSAGREGDNAAIVAAGSWLFLLDDGAELTVANASEKQYQILKKYTVADSPTWAHPAIIGKQVLIKDQNSLALWSFE